MTGTPAFEKETELVETGDTDAFFLELVREIRAAGLGCSMTGGLACVEYGLVEHTLDCDLIVEVEKASQLIELLAAREFRGARCRYRGHLSAPLDPRWLGYGWTSHFLWDLGAASAYLDIFGQAPRAEKPWWSDASPFAPRDTVAGMKRTQRLKDWSQATGLGLQMLADGDERGWLHIFDVEALRGALEHQSPPAGLLLRRPVLSLALREHPLLERAVQTEIDYWTKLDRLRLRAYRDAGKSYVLAVKATPVEDELLADHARRVAAAEQTLPNNPLGRAPLSALELRAREEVGLGLAPELMGYLPPLGDNFEYGGGQ